jgi:anti-sigma regulatory factor (Ser/Thr protein kinase)
MVRVPPTTVTRSLTRDAIEHPRDLPSCLAIRHGMAVSTARKHLRRLAEAGWLAKRTDRGSPWEPGPLREMTQDYDLDGLDEHSPWVGDFAPFLALSEPLRRSVQHAFGELVNNAIDHSEGTTVTVSVRQNHTHLHLLVSDNGCGAFDKLAKAFSLGQPERAAFELTKGKLTTQPLLHGGRGLFFVSRLADAFELHANGWVFRRRHGAASSRLQSHPVARKGSSVFLSFRLDCTRTPDEVYRSHGTPESPWAFASTSVPLRLLADVSLDSRAQARWVASRLEQFALAELDFEGVQHVGPSFADELFRVFASAHPQTRLHPLHMSSAIAELIAAATPAAAVSPGAAFEAAEAAVS